MVPFKRLFASFSTLMLLMLTTTSTWASEGGEGWQGGMNDFFNNYINKYVAAFLFWELPLVKLPLIVGVMVAGGIFFTFYYKFLNIRLFGHALQVVRGKYDDPEHEGEISHFQALTSALSATVGLGNIAGVAVAIQLGGPGAVFWLWLSAFFGMSLKFSSCTFAQLYRLVKKDGTVIGGPMVYLSKGFNDIVKLPALGKFLGLIYAILAVGASFGGGNMFQGNQTYELLAKQYPVLEGQNLLVGIALAVLAGAVLLGGIKRIAEVTSKMVPAMCAFYVAGCLIIIFGNLSAVPSLFISIFEQAFNPDAIYAGGAIGVMVQGIRRASFSNEAGVGSAAIAHAAAKTDEPVREGVVAMIGPFIDTHLVCTMTSLAILITGAHLDPALAGKGVEITAKAFGSISSVMPDLLAIAAAIFAYSTMISWSYYGEKAWEYLFGPGKNLIYKFIYIGFIVLGPVLKLGAVLDFSDLMILGMALPNIVGMLFLAPRVKGMVVEYLGKLSSGQFKTFK